MLLTFLRNPIRSAIRLASFSTPQNIFQTPRIYQQFPFTRTHQLQLPKLYRSICSNGQSNPQGREVLPTNVTPLHYDLTLEPKFDTFKFNGQETIDFKVNERTDYITLNSLEIEIQEAKLDEVPIKDISYDTDKQTVTFKLPDHLVEGSQAQLHLKFIGELNDKMAGFYRSTYKEDGTDRLS